MMPFIKGFGCGDDRLVFNNNSAYDVYLHFSCNENLDDLKLFRPDYYWVEHLQDTVYMQSDFLVEQSSSRKIVARGSWVRFIKSCNNDGMFLFVIKDSIVMNYTDREIRDKKLYEKKIKISLNDLQSSDWNIYYPR